MKYLNLGLLTRNPYHSILVMWPSWSTSMSLNNCRRLRMSWQAFKLEYEIDDVVGSGGDAGPSG